MKTQINKTVEVVLTLSQEEAQWLKTIVQNKFSEDETPTDSQMRKTFFEALKEVSH